MLTIQQITELAGRKGVRKIAVENFLSTLGNERNAAEATLNLYADAASYRWNAATRSAIQHGIDLFYSKLRR